MPAKTGTRVRKDRVESSLLVTSFGKPKLVDLAPPLVHVLFHSPRDGKMSSLVQKFENRDLIAKKRAKETGDSLTKRVEITAAMNFNFALLCLTRCSSAGPVIVSPPSSSLPSHNFLFQLFSKRSATPFVELAIPKRLSWIGDDEVLGHGADAGACGPWKSW